MIGLQDCLIFANFCRAATHLWSDTGLSNLKVEIFTHSRFV